MNTRKLLTALFAISLFATHTATAQDATTLPEAWEIVERCITTPTEPPDDWTFDGTIITYRYRDGVHGFRSDTPSRYYIAFDNGTEYGQAGSFSPNGQWFAVYTGHQTSYGLSASYYSVDNLRVVSTSPARETYLIPWQARTFSSGGMIHSPPIRWDSDSTIVTNGYLPTDQTLTTGDFSINPFTAEFVPYVRDTTSSNEYTALSPDGTRAITIELGDNGYGTMVEQRQYLYDIDEEIAISDLWATNGDNEIGLRLWLPYTDFGIQPPFWTPNSQLLISKSTFNDQSAVVSFTRDGALESVIFSGHILQPELAETGTSLALVGSTSADDELSLYIADLETRTVYNTCINPSHYRVAISPTGDQVAVSIGGNDGFVYVVDLNEWAAYRLDLAANDVIAWFADP